MRYRWEAFDHHLAGQIKKARLAANHSQRSLAELVGRPQSQLAEMEKFHRRLKVSDLLRIAMALRVRLSELILPALSDSEEPAEPGMPREVYRLCTCDQRPPPREGEFYKLWQKLAADINGGGWEALRREIDVWLQCQSKELRETTS